MSAAMADWDDQHGRKAYSVREPIPGRFEYVTRDGWEGRYYDSRAEAAQEAERALSRALSMRLKAQP